MFMFVPPQQNLNIIFEVVLLQRQFRYNSLPPTSAAEVIESVLSICLSVCVCVSTAGVFIIIQSIGAKGVLGQGTLQCGAQEVRQRSGIFIVEVLRREKSRGIHFLPNHKIQFHVKDRTYLIKVYLNKNFSFFPIHFPFTQKKMQLDIGMEPTFKFEHMIYICKEMGIVTDRQTDGQTDRQTDRRKATHMSPPCNSHRWAQKGYRNKTQLAQPENKAIRLRAFDILVRKNFLASSAGSLR